MIVKYITDDWKFDMQLTTDGVTPIPLTDLEPYGEFIHATAKPAITMTVANGGVEIIDAPLGKWRFLIPKEDTAGFSPAKGSRLAVSFVEQDGLRETWSILPVEVKAK